MPGQDLASLSKEIGGTLKEGPPVGSLDALGAELGGKVESLEDTIRRIAKAQGLDPELAVSVAKHESGLDPNAKGDSGKAVGLFQLHAGAAKDAGISDRSNPVENITGGVTYLKQLLDRYHGDTRKALMAYNGGPSAVDAGKVSDAAKAYADAILGPGTVPSMSPVASHAGDANPREAVWQEMVKRGAVFGPTPKPTAEEVRKTLHLSGQAGGAMAGAITGGEVGAPGGPIGMGLGAITGAGVGAFGGEGAASALESLGEWFGLLPKRAPAERPSVSDVAKNMGSAANTAMMGQALAESGMVILTPVAKAVMAPMRSKLSTYAQDALREFPPKSRAILPAEISESRPLNIVENISEGSLFGGSRISQVRATREALGKQKIAATVGELGPAVAAGEAGTAALQGREAGIAAFRQAERRVYGAFEDAAAGIRVPTPSLDAFVAELPSQQAGKILPNAGVTVAQKVAAITGGEAAGTPIVGGSKAAFSQLPASVQEAVLQAQGAGAPEAAPTAVEFSRTVSDLGKLVGELKQSAQRNPTLYNAQYGLAKRLYGLAKADLDAALAPHPEAAQAYERAVGVSKAGNARFFSKPIRNVAKLPPEKIAESLLQRNNSTTIKAVEKAVGPTAMQQVRRSAIDRLIPVDQATNQVNWVGLAAKIHDLGDDTLNALFPKGQAEELKRFSRLMLDIKSRPSTGVGRVGIMLTQWGAIAGLVSGKFPISSALTLGTPAIASRIMTSPLGLKWLTTGLEAPAGSAMAIKAAVMLTGFLRSDIGMPAMEPVTSHQSPGR